MPGDLEFKRRRTGVLSTGYFNAIGLPGVQVCDADGNEIEDHPANKTQINFDGDVTKLFHPVGVPRSGPGKSVESYGAVGDGETDDSDAIRNAIRGLADGEVLSFLPGKTYIISKKLEFFDMGNITILGNGCTFKQPADPSTFDSTTGPGGEAVFDFEDSLKGLTFKNANFEFPDITNIIEYNEDTVGDSGFYFEELRIHCRHDPIVMSAPSRSIANKSDVRIHNCSFTYEVSYGVNFRTGLTNLIVTDCRFVSVGSNGLNALGLYGESDNVIVSNNLFFNGGHSPIALSPCRNAVISNNICHWESTDGPQGPDEAAIEIEYKNHSADNFTSYRVIVTGNLIRGSYYKGIMVRNEVDDDDFLPHDILISNNMIQGVTGQSIYIQGKRCTIDGNHIVLEGDHENAILVDRCDFITISNNHIQKLNSSANGSGPIVHVREQPDDTYCIGLISGNLINGQTDDGGDNISIEDNVCCVTGNICCRDGFSSGTQYIRSSAGHEENVIQNNITFDISSAPA